MNGDLLQQVDRTYVEWKGRRLVYFGGCDYFRFSSEPAVLAAVRAGLSRYGLNVAASRVTSGNHALYKRLEKRLAAFFNSEAALLVSTGYLSNAVVTQALAGEISNAFIDERAHSSLRDAARFLGCPIVEFDHRSATALDRLVAAPGSRGRGRLLVLTDGVFAHDGSVAPLAQYLAVLPKNAWLLVDDAHGAGVLGKNGKGTHEYWGVDRSRIIQTVTLSKAFGTYGGVVLASERVVERAQLRSRAFSGSTPLPLPLAAGALAALDLAASDPSRRLQLAENTAYLKARLRSAGWTFPSCPVPIVAFGRRTSAQIERMSGRLVERGVYPSCIRYPGGGSRRFFRFALSSEHARNQLDQLAAGIQDANMPQPFRRAPESA